MKTRSIFTGIAAVLAVTLGITRLLAHDFWLVPEFFTAPAGWHIHVYANTGMRFPESTAALAPERVASARLVGADQIVEITHMNRIGKSLALEVTPPSEGQWYAAIEVKPRRIELTAEQFNEYLAHDGLPDILELRRERGELDKPGRELYQRGAKALLRAGSGGPEVWDKVLGLTIELVPLSNPERLSPGDTLGVRLLFRDEPVEGAVLAAGYAGFKGEGHVSESRTDVNGVARLPIPEAGRWYVRTIYMIERTDAPDLDWQSFWASLTFEVPEKN